jgi:hypothetical protein
MMFRVYPGIRSAAPGEPGGALFVARGKQGRGRHDAPTRYGALYLSRRSLSAAAEFIAPFRGQTLPEDAFLSGERQLSLAALDDSALSPLVDLDDAAELVKRSLRPSEVGTRDRDVTQPIGERLFDEGTDGFTWWSTIEASWQNVTLFAERAGRKLRLVEPPLPLTPEVPEVREAARLLEVDLV